MNFRGEFVTMIRGIREEKNRNESVNVVNLENDLPVKTGVLFENINSSLYKWLTTKEAAEYFRTTPRQIRKWVYQGKIRAYRLCGKSLRFKLSELDLLIKGGKTWV